LKFVLGSIVIAAALAFFLFSFAQCEAGATCINAARNIYFVDASPIHQLFGIADHISDSLGMG
jgi:hypothetical protein